MQVSYHQATPHFGHTDVSPLQVDGYEKNGKGLSPQGVLEIENNNATKVAMKQPRQIDIFGEVNGKKEERSTSKDRGGGEDTGGKAVLEHSLSNPEELGINPHNTLSQSPEKQTQTEPLHRTKVHLEALDTVIAGKEGYLCGRYWLSAVFYEAKGSSTKIQSATKLRFEKNIIELHTDVIMLTKWCIKKMFTQKCVLKNVLKLQQQKHPASNTLIKHDISRKIT